MDVDEELRRALVVCTPTFFRDKQDVRFSASMATLQACQAAGLRVVLVDGSPDEGVVHALESSGAVVVREEARGKGNALRQALRVAAERYPEAQVLAFQELEKTDFVRCYPRLVPGLLRAPGGEGRRWDFCNPARGDASWATYPVEQVLEEKFQNHLMQMISREHGFTCPLDWSFGPFLLRREHLSQWLAYPGQTYDAQWGPLVVALRQDPALLVGAPVVDYRHTQAMRDEEEGSLTHALRRLQQLNMCVEAHRAAWEKPLPEAQTQS